MSLLENKSVETKECLACAAVMLSTTGSYNNKLRLAISLILKLKYSKINIMSYVLKKESKKGLKFRKLILS